MTKKYPDTDEATPAKGEAAFLRHGNSGEGLASVIPMLQGQRRQEERDRVTSPRSVFGALPEPAEPSPER